MFKLRIEEVYNAICQETNQVIASILAFFPTSKAVKIINILPHENQSDVIRRIATMDRIDLNVINETEEIIKKNLSKIEDHVAVGGVKQAARIIARLKYKKEVIESMEDEDPELAEELKKEIKTFFKLKTMVINYFNQAISDIEIRLKGD
jgi:flagellar motor switch protein FliG